MCGLTRPTAPATLCRPRATLGETVHLQLLQRLEHAAAIPADLRNQLGGSECAALKQPHQLKLDVVVVPSSQRNSPLHPGGSGSFTSHRCEHRLHSMMSLSRIA